MTLSPSSSSNPPKFKPGDIVIDDRSKDISIILGIEPPKYRILCIDSGFGTYAIGEDTWAIEGVDNRSSLHEDSIVDKILTKYNL